MTPSSETYIITGALGWLGRSMLHALCNGSNGLSVGRHARIRALILPGHDDSELKKISDRIEVVKGDIRNVDDCLQLCRDAAGAVIFHTAGVIHPKRIGDFYDINVEGTKHILEASTRWGLKRIIAVSSNSPCGCNPHLTHTFDETSPYNPYQHYGRSKMLMERAVQSFQSEGRIETVIVRAPWFYGPYLPSRQALFFRMIREGMFPAVGDGANRRSMAYVDNLCEGMMRAAFCEKAAGETYWIADERPYSMKEIIETVERLLEQEFGQRCAHRRIRLPNVVSELAYMTDTCLQAVGLYNEKIHVLSELNKNITCSIAKAKVELGYSPQIAIEEGMRRSLQWCQTHGLLAN